VQNGKALHKHDTNGGLLCWSHGASSGVLDTFVNFDQDRPLLNIVLFSGFWYSPTRLHGAMAPDIVVWGLHR